MQPAFPFVDAFATTPVDLLDDDHARNPAVLVRDFKTDKTFIITRSDADPRSFRVLHVEARTR